MSGKNIKKLRMEYEKEISEMTVFGIQEISLSITFT